MSNQYYIAMYRDRQTGEPLAKPSVSMFTVDTGVPAPAASFDLDENGGVQFSWSAVEGATNYYVVKLVSPTSGDGPLLTEASILADTTETTWNSTDSTEETHRSGGDVLAQNYSFATVRQTEDDLHDPDFAPIGDGTFPDEHLFGIVAQTDKGLSSMSVIDTSGLAEVAPISEAFNAMKEMMGTGLRRVDAPDQLPTQMPVTMADGHTALRPVLWSHDLTEGTLQVGDEDDDGNITWTGSRAYYRVGYRIAGTLISGDYSIDVSDRNAVQQGVDAVIANVSAQRTKGGLTTGTIYTSVSSDLAGVTISSSGPTSPTR